MKLQKILCGLLALLLVCLSLSGAVVASPEDQAIITESEFADLLAQKTGRARIPLSEAAPLTFERAVQALYTHCMGAQAETSADALIFAMEAGLLEGVPATMGGAVTWADARRMAAGAAAYLDEQANQAWDTLLDGLAAGVTMFFESTNSDAMAPAPSMGRPQITSDYNNMNAESYGNFGENRFLNPALSPYSTFALDVDTASYANIRRMLLGGDLPDKSAVRLEEMLNYFDYDLPVPEPGAPIGIVTELAPCPWNAEHLLAMVALQGYTPEALPPSNLVFLVDVSGSMEAKNRLPLARAALGLLIDRLRPEDSVAIVTYAGTVGVALSPTSGAEKGKLKQALDGLHAGGATYGAGGIEAAYRLAREQFMEGGNNRVILLSDGDFNVGVHSASELQALIEREREGGVYLSVLGFGMGNYKDYEMETLADWGNGNYAYIDTLREAKKVLADDMLGTILTIADDVKVQVEFNPETVAGYRLLGYENRLLETEDFTDDQRDAGELGAGRQMIALYEIVPTGESGAGEASMRYQQVQTTGSDEILHVAVRYKLPGERESVAFDTVLSEMGAEMSGTMAFAAAVAELGLLLGRSAYAGAASYDALIERALEARGEDAFGYRAEFVQLADLARLIAIAQ